ncbi:MAG TPA: hypothetical protein VGF67_09545 [Ktedonobacteraceae bacterium]
MTSWDDDHWICLIVEQKSGFPVEYLSSTPECSGMGNPIPYLVVNGRFQQIPVDQFRRNPDCVTVKRWLNSLDVV